MKIDVLHKPSYALALCSLDQGEQVKAESGAMVTMSSNIHIESSSGGVAKGLKRALLGGESFFMNTFTAKGAPGEVTFAPTLSGDIVHLEMDGEMLIQASSYLASSPSIEIDTRYRGLKGLLSREGIFMLHARGRGDLLVGCFGAIHAVDVDGEYIVDSGHLVAFEPSLEYKVARVGGWIATLFSGEGLVSRFKGKGRLWLQTRNPGAFGALLGAMLPPRE